MEPRQNNQHNFSASISRKKTFTGLYTKWDSLTPRNTRSILSAHLLSVVIVFVYVLFSYNHHLNLYHVGTRSFAFWSIPAWFV